MQKKYRWLIVAIIFVGYSMLFIATTPPERCDSECERFISFNNDI